nr:hypothetical protein [Tanacetum cinerariifolium]
MFRFGEALLDLDATGGWMLVRYLRLFASGRKRKEMIYGDLPMIDMAELVVAAGASKVAEGALDVDEGDQAVLAPVQAPQPPIAEPARTMT